MEDIRLKFGGGGEELCTVVMVVMYKYKPMAEEVNLEEVANVEGKVEEEMKYNKGLVGG